MAHKHNRRRVKRSWDSNLPPDTSNYARHHLPERYNINLQPWRRASAASSTCSSFSSSSSTHDRQASAHITSSSPQIPVRNPSATPTPPAKISASPLPIPTPYNTTSIEPCSVIPPTAPPPPLPRRWNTWKRPHRDSRTTWQDPRIMSNNRCADDKNGQDINAQRRVAEQAARQQFEAQQIKLFGGEPGDDPELCFRMLEFFGGLDYMR